MATHGDLPTRSNTHASHGVSSAGYTSDDDAVPTNDPSSATGLLEERLQAWKHMCGYLENYVSAVAKDQKSQAKDQEKILKTLSNPLKEGHHFDQSLGGIAGLFENLRANTQAQSTLHLETEKNLTGSVLPILERLHSEIKNKRKELDKGAGKGSKAVDSARSASQKHIELLGQHTATFDSSGGKVSANNDPYVVQRGVWHRLNKQLMEENNNRSDLIQVQNSFQQFEAHVIQSVQTAINTYNQYMSGQADREKALYGDIAATASNIPMDFEWNGFTQRNSTVLISPNAPARKIESVSFPNQDHRSTKALIEGSLERKSRGMGALGGYKSGYYAVSPAGYLHEYKDNDNFRSDPSPETSLYLPDCIVGAVDGVKFSIKGKDASGNKISQKMSLSSDYNFKAHTSSDAQQWHSIIASLTGNSSGSAPTSPVDSRNVTPATVDNTAAAEKHQAAGGVTSPEATSAGGYGSIPPQSATSVEHGSYPSQGAVGTGHGSLPPQSAVGTGHGSLPPQSAVGTGHGSFPPQGAHPVEAAPPAASTTHYHGQPGTSDLEPRKY